jgi:predicted nucleotidyltransferase
VFHAVLFGSAARGDALPDSDVDILIELAPDNTPDLFAYSGFIHYIESLFPIRVDVVDRDALKPIFGEPLLVTRFMPSDSDSGPLLSEIAHNIALARELIGGLAFAEFKADLKAVYAVTRTLEIISEASHRLSAEIKQRHPEITWTGWRRKRLSPRVSGRSRGCSLEDCA